MITLQFLLFFLLLFLLLKFPFALLISHPVHTLFNPLESDYTMPFFSSSKGSSDTAVSPAVAATPMPPPAAAPSLASPTTPYDGARHPSFFSTTFGGFFHSPDGAGAAVSNAARESHHATESDTASGNRRARSLSRPRYSNIAPPITADEAMNLSRSSFDYRPQTAPSGGPSNNHHNYGRYDGGSLSRVVSAEPDFAAPTHQDVSHLAAGIPAFPSINTNIPKDSASSSISPVAAAAFSQQQQQQLQQKLERLQTSPSFAEQQSPKSPSSGMPYKPQHRLRRNSGSTRYQGIGLVAAYDQSIL